MPHTAKRARMHRRDATGVSAAEADAAPSLLASRDALLGGVDLALWGSCFDLAKLDDALAKLDALGDAARLAPEPELIFEAFRYGGPGDVVAVIIGQDPYPTPGDAQGLCFSVPCGRPLPASLKRIYGCLDRAGLRREHCVRAEGEAGETAAKGRGAAVSGDLRPWAVQGVLMLNAALTTRRGACRAHAVIWKPFVDDLLRRLCALRAAAGCRLHFLLWGGDARAYAPVARRHRHAVHEWTHPSPVGDNQRPLATRFKMCPHFEAVNAALADAGSRAIVWDGLAPVVAFSDGSCPRNGQPGARASFAAVLTGGPFGAAVVRGEIHPCEYAFVDDGAPELGVRPTGRPAAPSNNRGELLGIIFCFLGLLAGRALGHVEVVSDSEISVKTLTVWLAARRRKGTAGDLKNFDLVQLAERLLALLRLQALSVALTHTRSHQRAPAACAPPRDHLLWAGNAQADRHAALALASPAPSYEIEVLTAPAALRRFADRGVHGLSLAADTGAASADASLGAEIAHASTSAAPPATPAALPAVEWLGWLEEVVGGLEDLSEAALPE